MFNWYGVKKETSKAKVYSGLSFDELIEQGKNGVENLKLSKD